MSRPTPASPSPHPPHALGRWGEAIACRLLVRDGWRILERGYRLGRREVDIIARRDDLLAFVEVKTRTALAFGEPQEAVTWRKRREIEAVATDYLMRHVRSELGVRFDVVTVLAGPRGRILRCEHLEDAWRPEG